MRDVRSDVDDVVVELNHVIEACANELAREIDRATGPGDFYHTAVPPAPLGYGSKGRNQTFECRNKLKND
jgi:hypothetical protein